MTIKDNPLPYTFQSAGTSPASASMPFGASGTSRLRLVSVLPRSIHLSYSSIFFPADSRLREMATEKGLEPSTSSVTGWRSNRLNYSAKCSVLDYYTRCAVFCQHFFIIFFTFPDARPFLEISKFLLLILPLLCYNIPKSLF